MSETPATAAGRVDDTAGSDDTAGPADPGVPTGPDADRIAAVARGVPGVADLHGGAFGEAATYLPGRRVAGVEAGGARVVVHIVAALGANLSTSLESIAHAVRRAVLPLSDGAPVDVVVEDVREPANDPGGPGGAGGATAW